MSSISSVAPASTSTSTPPTLKTIVTVVAHGHGGGPMDLTGLTMHQSPVDGGGGGVSTHKGSGSPGPIANNPIIKAAEAFTGFVAKAVTGGALAKIGADLWGKYGSGIMSALSRSGKAVIDFITSLSEDESAPRSAQAAQPTTTLSQGDQTLLRNLMTSAKQAGVASLMPGAVKAVFTAMQSSGAIVDTTA